MQQDITVLSRKISDLKSQKEREKGQLEALKRQYAGLVKQCEEMDVTPNTLNSFIETKEQELIDLANDVKRKLDIVEAKKKAILSEGD